MVLLGHLLGLSKETVGGALVEEEVRVGELLSRLSSIRVSVGILTSLVPPSSTLILLLL